MDLEEIGINVGNWVDSAQDRNCWRALVNTCKNVGKKSIILPGVIYSCEAWSLTLKEESS